MGIQSPRMDHISLVSRPLPPREKVSLGVGEGKFLSWWEGPGYEARTT